MGAASTGTAYGISSGGGWDCGGGGWVNEAYAAQGDGAGW